MKEHTTTKQFKHLGWFWFLLFGGGLLSGMLLFFGGMTLIGMVGFMVAAMGGVGFLMCLMKILQRQTNELLLELHNKKFSDWCTCELCKSLRD